MKTKTDADADDLVRQFDVMMKQAELAADLEVALKHIFPSDEPETQKNFATDHGMGSAKGVDAALPWRNRLSSVVDVMADWTRLAESYLAYGNSSVGTTMGATAATARSGKAAWANQCRWSQGDLMLTIAIEGERVLLSIDDGPDVDISRLGWVDEASLGANPEAAPVLELFDVTRTGERLFLVDAPSGDVSDRLSAIKKIEKRGSNDPRPLLPFVEWA